MKTETQIAGECAWCESSLTEAVLGVGSSFSETIPPDDAFHRVTLSGSNRSLYAAVIKSGSRVFPEGFRLIFASCSDHCTDEIEKGLATESDRFGERIKLVPEE